MSRAVKATVCVIVISLLSGCGSLSIVPRPVPTERLDGPRTTAVALNAKTPTPAP